MVEFASDKRYIDGTSFSPRMTVSLDIAYQIKDNPKSYRLQIREKNFKRQSV